MRMRWFLPLALVAVVAGGCRGGPATVTSPAASPTSAPSTSSPTATSPSLPPPASTSPTPAAEIRLPSDAPTSFDTDLAPQELPLDELVPPGAEVDSTWILGPPADPVRQVGIVWARGTDPFAREHGFELWRPSGGHPSWRVVYAFTDPAAKGVDGIRTASGDLTGDGIADLLTFEDTDGSGGCGTWRVIASDEAGATEIFRRMTCDTQIQIVDGTLRVRAAVYAPGDAHCCPSAFRTTTLRWDGASWSVVGVILSPTSS
jgi:hypothetical protein